MRLFKHKHATIKNSKILLLKKIAKIHVFLEYFVRIVFFF